MRIEFLQLHILLEVRLVITPLVPLIYLKNTEFPVLSSNSVVGQGLAAHRQLAFFFSREPTIHKYSTATLGTPTQNIEKKLLGPEPYMSPNSQAGNLDPKLYTTNPSTLRGGIRGYPSVIFSL